MASKMRRPFTLAPAEPALEPAVTPEPPDPVVETPPPAPQPSGMRPGFEQFMLYQIVHNDSQNFGVIFALGGASETELHGYYITPGKTKHFITALTWHCKAVGISEVKSHNPTSPEWIKAHE